MTSASSLSLSSTFLAEFFNFFGHFLSLGPSADHLGLDGALVGAAGDPEVAVLAPIGSPRIGSDL